MGTPCDDEVSHDQTEINGATEHQDEHEEDFCSPFCTCQCAHTISLETSFFEIAKLETPQDLNTENESLYNDDWVFKDEHPPRYSSLYLCGQV